MPDLSQWDADQPGTTKAWWIERRGCVPKGHHERFNQFTHLLNEYNLNPLPGNLAELEVCVGQLLKELGSRREPAIKTPLGQFAYKKLKKIERRRDGLDVPVDVPLREPINFHAPHAQSRALRQRVGGLLDRPEILSRTRLKRDTENLETALHNLLKAFGGDLPQAIPAAYDV